MANDSDIGQALKRAHARLLDMEHTISKIHSSCELLVQDAQSRQPADNVSSLRLMEVMCHELKDHLLEAQQEIDDLISSSGA